MSENKKKLRTKDLHEDFEEIKTNDELDISLTISKSSSSSVASQMNETKFNKDNDKIKDCGDDEKTIKKSDCTTDNDNKDNKTSI